VHTYIHTYIHTGHTQKNGVVSKCNTKFISQPTRAQYTLSAARIIQVSHALTAVRFLCLLRARRLQNGVAVGEGYLFAPF
jgi:hypothetical protein